jgi:hypothetical protein
VSHPTCTCLGTDVDDVSWVQEPPRDGRDRVPGVIAEIRDKLGSSDAISIS